MAKKEKIYTQEQKEDIILFVYNMMKNGYSFVFERERTMEMESNDHHCRISTSLFGDHKEISNISIKNKTTNKKISIHKGDIDITPNISMEYNYIQQEVGHIIELNKPVFYTDDEIEDVIGDPSLLGRRSVKVDHLIDNIEEKKKRKIKFE